LGPVDGRVAEAAGPIGRAGERVQLRVHLVAGDDARIAVGARLAEADLPVRRVGPEEVEGHAQVACSLDGVALGAGPVLVVRNGEERAALLHRIDSSARDVEVGGVRDVVAVALEVTRHVLLPAQHLAGAVPGEIRAVEGDLHRESARDVVVGVGIERFAAPGVVGLPGGGAGLEIEVGLAVVLDHERQIGRVAVVALHADEVEPRDGLVRHR
jgi:hypothetical protein